MKFPILTSVILFIIVLTRAIKRQDRKKINQEKLFWEREAQANATRRKSLDDLEYITIPWEELPVDTMKEDPTVADCVRQLQELSEQKIVNFTGYTNTDLKLQYGAPNIDLLSAYDQSYTLLVRTLQRWADALWDAGHTGEAAQIMEFAIRTRTDISRTYYKMAEYLSAEGRTSQIEQLLSTAETLRSANKDSIVRTLQTNYLSKEP